MKWTKLAVAVDDVGQAPKVEDLARSEGAHHDGKLAREADTAVWGCATCSDDEAGGPTTIELESNLMLPPTWRASCRRVETMVSMLFESVSEYEVSGGSGGLKNTRITQRRRNSLSWFGPIQSLRPTADDPYTQEHPKSGGYNRV